ncbi:MAG TPA: hypothetical protein PKO41_03110 [Dokdonella sp.]|uniref:hypothetical protein n=1 Tax=Dokdonella sp. TaxID=2291710 RepID=UPI0025C4F259|nr:hypothetical protein [Dokdonella sp.]MBX3690879.1 hypothetical protein [Dokdonella sp.]MCW5569145.1 hypothetical protein [Dokdonella sp.]HNR91395.1 hypothetical protein [Dokdonella sp.]
MSMQAATVNARAAVNALQGVSVICRNLAPLSSPMDDEQLRQRARLIDSVLRARRQMELLHNRAVQLAASLDRFHQRRRQVQGFVQVGDCVVAERGCRRGPAQVIDRRA